MESPNLDNIRCDRVPKEELPGFIGEVGKVVEKHGPEKYFVENRYNELLDLSPELGELNTVSRKSSITDDLGPQYTYRDDLLYTILSNYKSMYRSNIPSQRDDLNLVKREIESFLLKAQKGVMEKKAEFIGQMSKAVSNNSLLAAALSSLGLMVYFRELETVQGFIGLNINERRAYLSALPRMMTKSAKAISGETLQNLFSGIRLAALDHPTLDYSPLVNELNQLIIGYKSRIKTRETMRKTANIAARVKVSDAETAVVLTTTSNTTTVSEN